jgi:hypothetical protein
MSAYGLELFLFPSLSTQGMADQQLNVKTVTAWSNVVK